MNKRFPDNLTTSTQGLSPLDKSEVMPGSSKSRSKRRKLIVSGFVLLVILIAATALLVYRSKETKTSAVPTGIQLKQLLPKQADLPSGWTHGNLSSSGFRNFPGMGPPIRPAQCSYLGALNSIELVVALRTELSYASEWDTMTAKTGEYAGLPVGTLTIGVAEFNPGGASAAINTVKDWVQACPSWTDTALNIPYVSSVNPVADFSQQNIDIHATPNQQNSVGYRTEVLIVRKGNALVVVACTAQVGGSIPPLVDVARPLIHKL